MARSIVAAGMLTVAIAMPAHAQPPAADPKPPPAPVPVLRPWDAKDAPKKAPAAVPIQLSIRGAPGWFRVGVPLGWQFAADRISGRVRIATGDGRALRVWPMFLPRVLDAADAASLLRALNAQIAPKAPWSQVTVTRNGARMVAAAHAFDGEHTRATGLSLVSADGVTLALHVAAGAPARLFPQNRDLFAAVLESFVPFPGYVPGDPHLEQVAFERWTDPHERAFSLDVPKGWTVQGGTVRKAAVEIRHAVQLASPDRTILILAGDTELPLFVEPPGEVRAGERDGMATAMPFQPGHEFGRTYLDRRAGALLSGLAVEAARPLPELQQRLQAILDAFAGDGMNRRIVPGELQVRGTLNGAPARGYLYAAPSRIALTGRGTLWTLGDLGTLRGFIATQERLATATAVFERMWTSFESNPQWFRDNTRAIGAHARIAAEAGRHVAATIDRTYAPAVRATAYARYSRHGTDVVPLRDPLTQHDHMVQVGANYFWIDDRGFLVGARDAPEPDPLWIRDILNLAPR